MTLRAPAPPGRGRAAVPGNLTAVLRLDVPVGRMPVPDRLAAVHDAASPLRRRCSTGPRGGWCAAARTRAPRRG